MKNKLIWQLSLQNLKAHRKTIIPFILSSSILAGLIYVIVSLINNDYVINRHRVLQPIMIMAAFLSALFTAIFIIYASLFIYKQRNKEIGLYSVFGMNKGHLAKMNRIEIFIEWLIINAIAIPGGYLFGHLVFILLNRLMRDTGFRAMDYPFDFTAMIAVILITGFIMFLVLVMHYYKLSVSNPIRLMEAAKSGAKEPRTNFINLIIGLTLVGYGYYLALTTTGLVQSLNRIFIAVLLVIAGSYFLLGALSIFTLKLLKNNDNYYYQPQNFLTVSGMLYRMKANAVSLTSISILCTGLMIILGMTLTTYRGLEQQVNQIQDADYVVTDFDQDSTTFDEVLEGIVQDLNKELMIEDVRAFESTQIYFQLKNQDFLPLERPENAGTAKVFKEDDFNAAYKENVKLEKDQIGLVSNAQRWNQFDQVSFAGKDYEVVHLPAHGIESISVDFMHIVIPSSLSFEEVAEAYPSYAFQSQEVLPLSIQQQANIDAQGDHAKVLESLPEIQAKHGALIVSRYEARKLVYSFNGGALFLGIIVSIVLLVGIFLMIYFKQISEGYQDKDNYQIMQQVGLPKEMIKKSISNQVIWVFVLPLAIAVIHMIVSAKLIFGMLGLIGVRDWGQFVTSYIIVVIIFAIAYGIMYWLTSRTYYQLVSHGQ